MNESPRYVTCRCQHCDYGIEFNANELADENSVVQCPHCTKETRLFIPSSCLPGIPHELQESAGRVGFFCGEGIAEEPRTSIGANSTLDRANLAPPSDVQSPSLKPSEGNTAVTATKRKPSNPNDWRTVERWRKKLKTQNDSSGFKSKVVTLTQAQCETQIAQELIGLLVEIEKDGFITDHGARRLKEWLETKPDCEIQAFRFLLDKVRRILGYGKLAVNTASEIEIALDLQIAVERVLPKPIREPILAKRRTVVEELQNSLPASKEMIALIRQLGGTPRLGITRGEAHTLSEQLWHTPSDKQLSYIRGLGGNPPPDITREQAGDLIEQLLKGTRATEKQLQFICDLGGNPPAGLSHSAASELINGLLAQQKATPRQLMVLRFWNRLDLAQSTREEISHWIDQFYMEDPRRMKAWETFKREIGDDGSQNDPSLVEIGACHRFLDK